MKMKLNSRTSSLVILLSYVCLLHLTKSQTIPPKDNVHVVYCPSDFECNLTCGSFTTASSSCSCHPACTLFGDCCYNHQKYASFCTLDNGDENLFLNILSKYEGHFQCNFDMISKQRYWMVSSCPESWKGANKCDEGTSNYTVGSLEDMSDIPVVSLDGVTFRNIYCAACHEEDLTKLTPWSLEAEGCSETEKIDANSTLTIREKILYLVTNCKNVTFLPPEDQNLTVIPCHQIEHDVIDMTSLTCNSTVTSLFSNDNCSAVVSPVKVNDLPFKNIFCVYCYYANQSNTEVNISEQCYGYKSYNDLTYSEECLYDYETGVEVCPSPRLPPVMPISITFKFGGQNGGVLVSMKGNNVESTSFECNFGQVFDPLKSKCVQITCPDGYHLMESLCVEIPKPHTNISEACEEFIVDMTVRSSNMFNFTCSSYVELMLDCLPGDFMVTYKKYPRHKNVSCNMKPDNSYVSVRAFTTSVDIIPKLLSPFDAAVSPYSPSAICNSFHLIKILVYCTSFQSNATLECPSRWLNETRWRLKENSTHEMLINSKSEAIPVSEVMIQRFFLFSDDNGRLMTENISVARCKVGHFVKLSCPLLTALNASFFVPDENDAGILVYSKNMTVKLTPDMYKILPNGSIQVCNFLHNTGILTYTFLLEYSRLEIILSTVGISLSIICLSFTLVTYFVFQTLRSSLANILIMTLCSCLLLAQILLILAGFVSSFTPICAVVTGLGHFVWLSVFTTSSMLGLTLSKTFSLSNQAVLATQPSQKTVIWHLLICFGVPIAICGSLLVLFLANGDALGITYGSRGGCWIGGETVNLFAFGIPVAACLVANLFLFIHVTVSLCMQTRRSDRMRKSKQRNNFREVLIYAKIFMILGLTWIIGFAASFTNVQLLWYLFTILTSLQGVFIFLAFTVKSQIWRLWEERMGINASYSTISTSYNRVTYSANVKSSSKDNSIISV